MNRLRGVLEWENPLMEVVVAAAAATTPGECVCTSVLKVVDEMEGLRLAIYLSIYCPLWTDDWAVCTLGIGISR